MLKIPIGYGLREAGCAGQGGKMMLMAQKALLSGR